MAKFKDLADWQINLIKNNASTNTAEQLAVRAKTSLNKVYAVCAENKVKTLTSKQFKEALAHHRHISHIIISKNQQPSEPYIRPPAIYSNISPYGIATQLHQSKMF